MRPLMKGPRSLILTRTLFRRPPSRPRRAYPGQLPVGRGQERRVVDLARSRGLSLEAVIAAIPGGDAFFRPFGWSGRRGLRGWRRGCRGGPGRGAGDGKAEEKREEEPPAEGSDSQTRIAAGSTWAAPSSAGSSSSRTKISTCSGLAMTSRERPHGVWPRRRTGRSQSAQQVSRLAVSRASPKRPGGRAQPLVQLLAVPRRPARPP
jgi:hypothetical protein